MPRTAARALAVGPPPERSRVRSRSVTTAAMTPGTDGGGGLVNFGDRVTDPLRCPEERGCDRVPPASAERYRKGRGGCKRLRALGSSEEVQRTGVTEMGNQAPVDSYGLLRGGQPRGGLARLGAPRWN